MLRLTKNLKKSICPTELPKHLPKFRHIPKVPLSGGTTKDDHIILHPDIFAIEHPDIRLLKQAVTWQETYKLVDMTHRVWRLENFGSKNKPWRLNSGRTRRRDERGPSSLLGTTKGNFSGPWSMWSEFSEDKQCEALIAALTVRYAQGDLVIFDGDRLLEREDKSNKDYVLTIVGDLLVPKNFISQSKYNNVLPVTGLNVLTILNHDKLHIHLSAIHKIQQRLLDWRTRYPIGEYENFEMSERHNFYSDSEMVEARADWNKGDVVLDQVEADGKSYKYKDQHDFGSYFDGKEKFQEQIIRGD